MMTDDHIPRINIVQSNDHFYLINFYCDNDNSLTCFTSLVSQFHHMVIFTLL